MWADSIDPNAPIPTLLTGECAIDEHCSGDYSICSSAHKCVECLGDADCTDSDLSHCSSTFNCSECTADSQCAADEYCNPFGNKVADGGECEEKCITNADCSTKQYCDVPECINLSANLCIDDTHHNCSTGYICGTELASSSSPVVKKCVLISGIPSWEYESAKITNITIPLGQTIRLTMVLNTSTSQYNNKGISLTLKEKDTADADDVIKTIVAIPNSLGVIKTSFDLTEADLAKAGNETSYQFYFTDNFSLISTPAYLTVGIFVSPILINSITPTTATAAFPIEFVVNATGENLTTYDWNFGDGKTTKTSSNVINHTYVDIGDFALQVLISNSEGDNYSRQFSISVLGPSDYVNQTLNRKLKYLNNIEAALKNKESFIKIGITDNLGLDQIATDLEDIQAKFEQDNENNLISLMEKLNSVDLPSSIVFSGEGEEDFSSQSSNINNDAVENADGGGKSLSSTAKTQINSWADKNIQGSIKSNVVTFEYEDGSKESLTFFTISLENDGLQDATFFMKNLKGINFDGSDFDTTNNYYYENFNDKLEVSFSVPGEVSIDDLGYFVSPPLSYLSVDEIGETEDAEGGSGSWLIILLLVIGIAVVGYFIYKHFKKKPQTENKQISNINKNLHRIIQPQKPNSNQMIKFPKVNR